MRAAEEEGALGSARLVEKEKKAGLRSPRALELGGSLMGAVTSPGGAGAAGGGGVTGRFFEVNMSIGRR